MSTCTLFLYSGLTFSVCVFYTEKLSIVLGLLPYLYEFMSPLTAKARPRQRWKTVGCIEICNLSQYCLYQLLFTYEYKMVPSFYKTKKSGEEMEVVFCCIL
jgi:hypothetical protein